MHEGLGSNRISSVVYLGFGTYSVSLLRPLAHGEITTISYVGDGGTVTSGVFTYHPGNVNADNAGMSSSTDILSLVDAINGVTPFPIEQTDLDRSGVVSPSDILREIDLLNGAGEFDMWIGVQTRIEGCP